MRRDLQTGPWGCVGRQVHRLTWLGRRDLDRLHHHGQQLAVGVLRHHALHRKIAVGRTIDAILLEPGQRDLLAHIEHHAAGILDAQIALDHQGLGVNHQTGIAQIDRRLALGFDDNAVAAQAQRAQGLIPHDVFDARDQLAIGQRDHVLGRRRGHRLEAQAQGVVPHLARAAVHIFQPERARQAVGRHGVAQVHGDLVSALGGAHHQRRIGQTHHRQLVSQEAQTHLVEQAAVQAQRIAAGRQNLEVARVVRGFERHRFLHHQRHLAHHRIHAVAQRHHQRAGDAILAGHELQITHIGQEARKLGHRACELDA